MKNYFYAIGLTLAVGFSSFAATPQLTQKNIALKDVQTQQTMPANVPTSFTATPKVKKTTQTAPIAATEDDFVGEYKWFGGLNLLEGEVLANNGTMSVTKSQDNPGKLVVSGLIEGYPLDNCYVEDGRLYIPDQELFYHTGYYYSVWFYTFRFVEDGGEYYLDLGDEFYFTMQEDGTLLAGEIPWDQQKWDKKEYTQEDLDKLPVMGVAMPEDLSGFFLLNIGVHAEPIDVFSYVSDEWEPIGDSQFKDAWFSVLWDDFDTPEYPVPTYRNKQNQNKFLLMDPYGPESPYWGFNISETPGYIIVDIGDIDCVYCEPYVFSLEREYWLDDEGTETALERMYCYNLEGNFIGVQDATTDDVINLFDIYRLDLSYFDDNSRTAYIYNACFGVTGEMGALYTWGDDVPMEGYVILPEGYDSGVESILGDDSNAPVEYYNLQGVRLAQPEKGQLVIVRKGSKAAKVIVR